MSLFSILFGGLPGKALGASCDTSAIQNRLSRFLLSDSDIQSRCELSAQAGHDQILDPDNNQISACIFGYRSRRDKAQALISQDQAYCTKINAQAANMACTSDTSQQACEQSLRDISQAGAKSSGDISTSALEAASSETKFRKYAQRVRQRIASDRDQIEKAVKSVTPSRRAQLLEQSSLP